MDKKSLSAKQRKSRFVLAVALAGIMFVLVVGYFLTRNIKQPAEQKQTVKNTAEEVTMESTTYYDGILSASDKSGSGTPSAEGLDEGTTSAKTFAKIVDPSDSKEWFLAIISVDHPLPDNYSPSLSLAAGSNQVKLDSRMAPKFKRMYDGAKLSDCNLNPYAGYKNYSYQDNAYQRKVSSYLNQGYSQDEAEKLAKRKVAPAGCSESNSGLAIDIVSASTDFENTKEFQWLQDNAYKYGFVLRYPKDKEDITGVDYQPWHWRYVGEYAASKMYEQNLCLEEYLGIV